MMKNKKAILPSVLIAGVTAFIFSNSLKDGVQSKEDSDFFLNLFRPILEWLSGNDGFVMNYIVRKGAHMAEFFVLALLIGWLSYVLKKNFHGYGLMYPLSVAILDEWIQSFTGRTSQVLDILIDFLGALLGFAFFLLIRRLKKRKENSVDDSK